MKPRMRVKATSVHIGDLHRLDCVTSLDLDPAVVLGAALGCDLTDVVVIGYLPTGEEYFASSIADGGTVLWLLERSKKALLSVDASDAPPRVVNPEGTVLPFIKPEGERHEPR